MANKSEEDKKKELKFGIFMNALGNGKKLSQLVESLPAIEATDSIEANKAIQQLQGYFAERGITPPQDPKNVIELTKGYIGSEFGKKAYDNLETYLNIVYDRVAASKKGLEYDVVVNSMEKFAKEHGIEPLLEGELGEEYNAHSDTLEEAIKGKMSEEKAEEVAKEFFSKLNLEDETKKFLTEFYKTKGKDLGIQRFYMNAAVHKLREYVKKHPDEFKKYAADLGKKVWDKSTDKYAAYNDLGEQVNDMAKIENAYTKSTREEAEA